MIIGDRLVGPGEPTFVISEVSCNHEGSLAKALQLIDCAAGAGADAVKFQLYRSEDLVDPASRWEIEAGPWAGQTYGDLYRMAATPAEWFPELFAAARARGLIPFASAFAPWAVDVLEALDCAAYKVASLELGEVGLIACMAATGRPLVLSTGDAGAETIGTAIAACGATPHVLLHCVAAYPAPLDAMSLRRIPALAMQYGCPVGLSDHSREPLVAELAVALGACVVEAHLMLPRPNAALDAGHSLEPQEFKDMVAGIRHAERAAAWRPGAQAAAEKASVGAFRRRWCAAVDLAPGATLAPEDVRTYRAPVGLLASGPSPVGHPLLHGVHAGAPFTREDFA